MNTQGKSRGLIWWIWKQIFLAFLLILACFQLSYFFDYHSNNDVACSFPKVDLYTEQIIHYLKLNPFYVTCEKVPLLFNSTLNGTIVPARIKDDYSLEGISNCCYKQFWREGDSSVKFSDECHPLSFEEETKIPAEHELISIWCERGGQEQLFDFHLFTPVKPEVEKRLDKIISDEGVKERKVNVVILGIDSLSRMNLMRTMPNTLNYLKELGAVDMQGYNKIGDNTYENIFPFLASLSGREIDYGCAWSKEFDTCPLIWKNYEKKGYRTSYFEDGDKLAGTVFNHYRNGFLEMPTHYYMRPLSVAFWTSGIMPNKLCYGPRLGFEQMLGNIKKFIYNMNGKPHFQFAWAGPLAHDHIRSSEYGDAHVLDLLRWMGEIGYLENTVVILMSDHGLRYSAFRETLQGQIEDRLPFAYLLIPEWIKRNYSGAYLNLLGNREKLVTAYDLHEVLVDLLNLERIENDEVERRKDEMNYELVTNFTISRGISLFLPIPKERTCAMAQIDPNYCSCNKVIEVPIESEEAKKAALVAVERINSIIESYKKCAVLELASVLIAQSEEEAVGVWQGLKVNFETRPSNGTFEALVQVGKKDEEWTVLGTISRTNAYGNSSWCVEDALAKLYCYCI